VVWHGYRNTAPYRKTHPDAKTGWNRIAPKRPLKHA